MATKKEAPAKEVEAKVSEEKVAKKAPVKKAPAKKAASKAKTEKVEKRFKNPTHKQFEVILNPVITEKSMDAMQNLNKVTIKVLPTASKVEIKKAFESLYQVEVKSVSVSNVRAKESSRGGRYKGTLPGYKKAVITLKAGEALDLFKE